MFSMDVLMFRLQWRYRSYIFDGDADLCEQEIVFGETRREAINDLPELMIVMTDKLEAEEAQEQKSNDNNIDKKKKFTCGTSLCTSKLSGGAQLSNIYKVPGTVNVLTNENIQN